MLEYWKVSEYKSYFDLLINILVNSHRAQMKPDEAYKFVVLAENSYPVI